MVLVGAALGHDVDRRRPRSVARRATRRSRPRRPRTSRSRRTCSCRRSDAGRGCRRCCPCRGAVHLIDHVAGALRDEVRARRRWRSGCPPTLTVSIWTPGTCEMSDQTSRAVGISWSSSREKFWPVSTWRGSMSGVALVTVTASCTADSRSWTSTCVLRADVDEDVLAGDGREARHGNRHRVPAGGDLEESEEAVRVDAGRHRLPLAGERRGAARKHASGLVDDVSVDVTGVGSAPRRGVQVRRAPRTRPALEPSRIST